MIESIPLISYTFLLHHKYFQNFHTLYLDHIFFLSPNFLMYSLSSSWEMTWSFCLSKQKQKTNLQPITITKKGKLKNAHKIIESIFCCEFCPRVWLISPSSLHWRTYFCFPRSCQLQKASCVGMGLCAYLLFSRILSVLNLCRSCVCYHSLWEVICALALLGLEDIDSLEPFITFGSYDLSVSTFPSISELWDKSFDKDWIIQWMLTMSTHCRVLGPYVNCYLPQEAPLNVSWAMRW